MSRQRYTDKSKEKKGNSVPHKVKLTAECTKQNKALRYVMI